MRPWGIRTSRPGHPRRSPVVPLGVLAVVLVVAAVVLPYQAFLTRPELVGVVGGLTVLGCGLVLIRDGAVGPVGPLLYASGAFWFAPSLAVTGQPAVDVAVRCTALLHLALLNHAVVVVGSTRPHGRAELVTVGSGYAVALTAVVGGYRVALPALGAMVIACALLSGRRLPRSVRAWRRSAGLLLGIGLLVDALLRVRAGVAIERWVAVTHPAEVAAVAVLVTIAATRPSAWQSIDVGLDGTDSLTGAVAALLDAPTLSLALSDGEGGWLRPTGERRAKPSSPAAFVTDDRGATVAVLEDVVLDAVPASVEHVLRLAADNARLRRSLVRHVEDLEQSRRRLLTAADAERAALGAQLRARAIATIAATERELRRTPTLRDVVPRASSTRAQLELIARGIDPVASGPLRAALDELAARAACDVRVVECEEPRRAEVAGALWFCCAEAATNTTKHAPGSTLEIRVERDGDRLVAHLTDDGPGGALASGSGLRGLADRLETLGGSLTVRSPVGAGTSLVIDLPDEDCGQPQSDLPARADPGRDRPTYVRGDRHPGGTS